MRRIRCYLLLCFSLTMTVFAADTPFTPEQVKKLSKTATGAYINFLNPHEKDFNKAFEKTLFHVFKAIKKNGKSKNRIVSQDLLNQLTDNLDATVKESEILVKKIVLEEAKHDHYSVLYHGHANAYRLFLDVLNVFKNYAALLDTENQNPLRVGIESNFTVGNFLPKYKEEAEKWALENNIKLYDNKRTLGYGFAPDVKLSFARGHLISTNLSLFGNHDYLLAECTFFYFWDSFNITKPSDFLIKLLLSSYLKNLSETEIADLSAKLMKVFEDTMVKSGGGLLQLFIRKSIIDKIVFASWMKGIPIFIDKKTQRLATRGSNYKAIQQLIPSEKYILPLFSDYLEAYISNPEKFVDTYTSQNVKKHGNRFEFYDRAQARMIVNSSLFETNEEPNIFIKSYTRNKLQREEVQDYYEKINGICRNAVIDYVKNHIQTNPNETQLTELQKNKLINKINEIHHSLMVMPAFIEDVLFNSEQSYAINENKI